MIFLSLFRRWLHDKRQGGASAQRTFCRGPENCLSHILVRNFGFWFSMLNLCPWTHTRPNVGLAFVISIATRLIEAVKRSNTITENKAVDTPSRGQVDRSGIAKKNLNYGPTDRPTVAWLLLMNKPVQATWCVISVIIGEAKRTNLRTDWPTEGWTDFLEEMR